MFGKRFLITLCGLLMVIGGVFSLFQPVNTFMQIGYVIGFVMLCDAIGNILIWFDAKKYAEVSGWYLFDAIVSLIFAIALVCSLRMQIVTDIVITYMISTWIVILGIFRIVMALRIKSLSDRFPENFKNNKWVAVLLLGIVVVILGILFFIRPVVLMGILGTLIAIAMILIGANLFTIGTYIF